MTNSIAKPDTPAPPDAIRTMPVCDYFEAEAPFWREIYERDDVFAVIHQQRRAIALSMVDQLAFPAETQVLEIGCGAGVTSVALAQRGLAVTATDVAPSMLDLTREFAASNRVSQAVETKQCDVYNLPFTSQSFELVMALGVLPWLPTLDEPMREMTRVLRPGGYLILNIDNRMRLNHVIHPFAWARVFGITIPERVAFWRTRRTSPAAHMYFPGDFDSRLSGYGLAKFWSMTLGFGPFWGISKLLPRSFGVRLHRFLQSLADKGVPPFRATGSQYLCVLRKAG